MLLGILNVQIYNCKGTPHPAKSVTDRHKSYGPAIGATIPEVIMAHAECPRCKRKSVGVVTSAAGTPEKSRCGSCGWEGPKCFAQKWDPTSPKCKGGADPTNWANGTHVRPKCSFEAHCGSAQDKMNKEQLIPAMNMLTRPKQQVEVTGGMAIPQQTTAVQPRQVVPQPPRQTVVQRPTAAVQRTNGVSLSVQQAPAQARTPTPQHPVNIQAPGMGSPMAWVQPQQAATPALVPQNYPQPGMQVPAYLTAPEPMEQGIVPMFFNSMARAAFKGAFHTAANLMDHVPWGGYAPPPTSNIGQG